MPNNKNAFIRYRIIDRCLRNYERPWTKKDIFREVNSYLIARHGEEAAITEHTIRHDLDDIEFTLGAPLERYPEKTPRFYRYSDPEYSLFNVALTIMDNARLTRALETLSLIKGLDLAEEVQPIISFLQNKTLLKSDTYKKIMQFDHQPVASGSEYIEELLSSIQQKTSLKVKYKRFSKKTISTHIFHPYVLKEYNNRWFCLGYCSKSKQVINIGLDRIVGKLEISNEDYHENTFFSPNVYFDDIMGVTHPAQIKRQLIQFEISKERFPYIKSKPLHESQKIEKIKSNGKVTISLQLVPNKELLSALLSYGSDIKIMTPSTLAVKVINELRKNIKNYMK